MLIRKEYQMEVECKKWVLLLHSLKDENVFLLLKLSKVLDGKVDMDFILKAEYFQNEFIVKDEYIKEMENDIKMELQLIGCLPDKMPVKIVKNHERLKNEIKYIQNSFSKLKDEFNKSITKD